LNGQPHGFGEINFSPNELKYGFRGFGTFTYGELHNGPAYFIEIDDDGNHYGTFFYKHASWKIF
jgi:hypothetical protein